MYGVIESEAPTPGRERSEDHGTGSNDDVNGNRKHVAGRKAAG